MVESMIVGVALGVLALKALAVFALSYAGARLAIRHERTGSRLGERV